MGAFGCRSNFQFIWPWEEWAYVLDLPKWAPQRVFVQEVLEREVRLSYWEKIKQVSFLMGIVSSFGNNISLEFCKFFVCLFIYLFVVVLVVRICYLFKQHTELSDFSI
jgi:hypothetical protein